MRLLVSLLIFCASIVALPAHALFGNNQPTLDFDTNNSFVPVDVAFPFDPQQEGETLYLDWQVKKGYYLYQERLSISASNVTLGEQLMRNGKPYHDEFFGDVNIYTDPLLVTIPLTEYQEGAQVIVQYQGCAQAGFCYPPETRIIDIQPFDNTSSNPQSANSLESTAISEKTTHSLRLHQTTKHRPLKQIFRFHARQA